MITDRDGAAVDLDTALRSIVSALDDRSPRHNSIGDRLCRLLQELGELAEAIYLTEQIPEMGHSPLTKKLQDCLHAVGAIAHHHGVNLRVPDPAPIDSSNPYVLHILAAQAGGAIARTAHHAQDMSLKKLERGVDKDAVTAAVSRFVEAIAAIAGHYALLEALCRSLEQTYRDCQLGGYLPGEEARDAS